MTLAEFGVDLSHLLTLLFAHMKVVRDFAVYSTLPEGSLINFGGSCIIQTNDLRHCNPQRGTSFLKNHGDCCFDDVMVVCEVLLLNRRSLDESTSCVCLGSFYAAAYYTPAVVCLKLMLGTRR